MSEITVPSGQPVTLLEALVETGQMRFRFVAPELATRPFEEAEADMAALCESVALPAAKWQNIETVVISLADREIALGDTDPEVTQYFEAFSLSDEGCVRELF